MALELQAITKKVGQATHIKATSLVLEPGRFNVLLGETGSGKTSLIKLMAGLDKMSSGRLMMNGQDVTGMSPQKRNISLVHQFFVNYPHMTVFDNIASPLRVAGMAASEIQGRVEAAADVLRLRPMLKRRPHELSGGQQQRTALARAIAKESTAVFLDEPLANLDYKLREELRDQLPDLFAGRGAVVVYATSEPAEALMLEKRGGLDLAQAWQAIAASSGNSFVHETEGALILNGSCDIGFSIDLALKDLGFALEFGREFGVPLDLAALTQQTYVAAKAAYGGAAQSPMIARLLEDLLGTDLRAPGFPARLE